MHTFFISEAAAANAPSKSRGPRTCRGDSPLPDEFPREVRIVHAQPEPIYSLFESTSCRVQVCQRVEEER